MKRKGRIATAVLCAALCLTACRSESLDPIEIPTEADEVDLTSTPEGVAFSDMEYLDFDFDAWESLIAQAYEELDAAEQDTDAVFALVDQIKEGFYAANRDYELAQIHYFYDTGDTFYAEQFSSISEHAAQIREEYQKLGYQLINQYHLGSQMAAHFTTGQMQIFYQYSATPENILELNEEQAQLVAEYLDLFSKVTYDEEKSAYIGLDTYGSQMAEIYSRLVEVRQELGENTAEQDYVSYMDDNYMRDYSSEDIENLESLVKADLVPFYKENKDLRQKNAAKLNPVFSDLSNDDLLLLIRNSMDEVSPGMQKVFAYAQEYDLIQLTDSETSLDEGYTTVIPDYNEPVIYNRRYDTYEDLTRTVHEFGHFYVDYYGLSGYVDVAECDSQGLEALYACMYPEMFGEITGTMMEQAEVLTLTNTVISATMIGEFEREAYRSEDPDAQTLTDAYWKLAGEYGYEQGDYDGSEYAWTMIHHLFDKPMYYISYAPSCMAALTIWAEGQEDFDAAVDSYRTYEANGQVLQFSDMLNATGFDAPWTEAGMSRVADALEGYFK